VSSVQVHTRISSLNSIEEYASVCSLCCWMADHLHYRQMPRSSIAIILSVVILFAVILFFFCFFCFCFFVLGVRQD
jgi:hypothetical protein